MIGQTLGRYRIVEKLGAGGMGEVYRAHDEQLKRDVAIKVLLADTLADDHARKRFRKEAETLSKLNHPNIAQIHDFGSQDELDFLVMEQVPGESLKDKLDQGSLPEKELIRLGGQIADALQEAHERGVVHRDLKPGNVKLTAKGQAKVLDFGIAKLLQSVTEATTQTFTETHSLAGTLPYMSPEQVRAEPVDARSDLYSFGVMLYQMATARRPFEEKVSTVLSDAILHQAPPAPRTVNRKLSVGLENIILKCLEKEPERRYQSAKEVRIDLERLGAGIPVAAPARARPWTRRLWFAAVGVVALAALLVGWNVGGLRDQLLGRPAPGDITSIAVLPLENLSGDPEQDYFADGMTEALITDLSKIGALKVISRTSVMQYKETKKPLPEIAQELNVDAVVEGSVLREGERVRISAQLIEARTDQHLWAQRYERNLTSILALQSEVARAIASEIRIAVTPAEEARLASARSVNPEAHEAYLKGRYYWNQRTAEGFRKAVEYFQQAIEADPDYALAYAGLADAYVVEPSYGRFSPRESASRVKSAAMKALEIDDTLAEAYNSLAAMQASYEWDWLAAERNFQRVLALKPNYATAHQWYAIHLSAMGRFDEAIREIARASELDPLSTIIDGNTGEIFYRARRYDEAIRHCREALRENPSSHPAHECLGVAHEQKGLLDEAIAEFQKTVTLSPESSIYVGELGRAYAKAGRRDEALAIAAELEELSKERHVSGGVMASIYASLGDNDRAIEWLEKGYEDREWLIRFLQVDPMFDPLRSDPRFQSLLRRMNFPE
jgi:serine/threonine-protein kinase